MSELTAAKKETVRFLTLGCRLNQYETQGIRESLAARGYEEVNRNAAADVYVINTCTVTAESDKESRYLIRRCHRENPNAKIIVTGCYVEKNSREVAELPGVSRVVLNREKPDIADLLDSCTGLTLETFRMPERSKAEFTPLRISEFLGRVRAHVKIQDGCNHACSFCKVVLVRGKSRSRPFLDILEEAERLRDHGYREIVLTGIQLGAYGLDLERKKTLPFVIRRLSEIDGIDRIRLSSIEPIDVTDELIDAMAETPKACPHLHIPLQSGSDRVLKAMNRRYDRAYYLALIGRLRERLADFILTTDVMAGFPSETDTDFEETIDLLLRAKPFKLHVFPYSAREGTRAFALSPVLPAVIEKRIWVLRELERKLQQELMNRFIGKQFSILVEERRADGDCHEGRAANYLPVRLNSKSAVRLGELRVIRTLGADGDHLIGELADLVRRDQQEVST